MSILQYKVVSYIAEDGTQPYLIGFYDTEDVAKRACNSYNQVYSFNGMFVAKVEKA